MRSHSRRNTYKHKLYHTNLVLQQNGERYLNNGIGESEVFLGEVDKRRIIRGVSAITLQVCGVWQEQYDPNDTREDEPSWSLNLDIRLPY
jgi:hypothetical protein